MIALEIRKLIIKNREDGVPVSEISRILHVSESAIYSICRKYKERKHLNGSYPGRKPRITEEQKAAMIDPCSGRTVGYYTGRNHRKIKSSNQKIKSECHSSRREDVF